MRLKGIAALAAVVVAGAVARGDQPTALEWKLPKGDALRYRMTQTQSQKMAGFQQATASHEQSIVMRQDVTDVAAEGTASIACTYEAVRMEMVQGMGARVVYDSTAPDDATRRRDPQLQALARLVGEKVTYKVGKLGEVSDVQGFDRVIEKTTAGMKDDPRSAPMVAAMKAALGNEAMKQQLESAFRVLPDHPVAPGESWSRAIETKAPMIGTIRIETKYTLGGPDKVGDTPCVKIETASTLALTTPAAPDPQENPVAAMFKVELKDGRMKGEIHFDAAAGRILRSVATTTMDLELEVRSPGGPPAPGGPGGATPTARPAPPKILQHIDQKMRLELIPKDAPAFEPAGGGQPGK